jgi:hypothetical protein
MYHVLLESCDPQMLDQTPPELKNLINIDLHPVEGREYDAVFVYERVEKPITFKVRQNSIVFIPGEPESIKGFSTPFVKQFDHTMSFRRDLDYIHNIPNVPCLTPWRVDLDESLERSGSPRNIRTIEQARSKTIEKSKFMSMIVSDKVGTPLQRARLKLSKVLQQFYPGLVDIYGRGHNQIDNKSDALDPYLFSIAVENSYLPNYVTEKLTDCLVTATIPLYYGCPNLDLYYASGIINIDIWDIEGTIQKIIELHGKAEEVYKSNVNQLVSQREQLFTQHSIISRIYHFVSTYYPYSIVEKSLVPDQVGYYW